ncbi:pyridoxal phosphate-dependent aminotransferase [Sedimentibacter sp. zth1]|uniref:pyridoxal phosphate-dependent aminotransferase n=1 Tax=Sedimentibacter sp. zth1 TaxID=2816908 RepID=UPI001A9337EC|nr:pyridoxal phosphate-dependent aminotransferase [Sedimentibacter sp. zth1]QSX05370.1 pyridoxal phosphate-dependent aminotransferase [Sedimentibacter sp. zth1]
MKYSNRINEMQLSPIRKLVPIAESAKKQGKKVYHLNIGQPDIETPKEFFEAIKNYDQKVLAYAFSQGLPVLIDSFIKYYKSFGVEYDKDEILITNGGSEAIQFTLVATCDNGDEILVPEPFYTNYNSFGKYAGVKVVPITTKAENGFKLPSKEEIVSKITNKTKAIMLSNPGNPTGAIYSKEQVEMVKQIAIENNLYIIADEVYREFVYDGMDYVSFSQLEGIDDRLILTDSISKRYSACGARIGCIVCKNKELMGQIMKLCQARLCVPTIEQVGAAALVDVSPEYMKNAIAEYQLRRDVVYSALEKMDGVICEQPKGAFYIIAKLPIKNAENFVKWMLTDFDVDGKTVMMAPAEGFYATKGLGVDEVRLSYVLKKEDLEDAMMILAKGLETYRKIEK